MPVKQVENVNPRISPVTTGHVKMLNQQLNCVNCQTEKQNQNCIEKIN